MLFKLPNSHDCIVLKCNSAVRENDKPLEVVTFPAGIVLPEEAMHLSLERQTYKMFEALTNSNAKNTALNVV